MITLYGWTETGMVKDSIDATERSATLFAWEGDVVKALNAAESTFGFLLGCLDDIDVKTDPMEILEAIGKVRQHATRGRKEADLARQGLFS